MRQILLFLCLPLSFTAISQDDWQDLRDEGANFYDIQAAFNEEWEGKEYVRGAGFKQYKRWEYFMEPRVYPDGDIQISKKYMAALDQQKKNKKADGNKSGGDWSFVGYSEWETDSYNPGNGRTSMVAKDFLQDGVYYVGTPAGGLWKTSDNFQTWVPLTDYLPTLGVSSILVHPEDSDIIYIGTGDSSASDTYSNGVLKSLDGGITWQTTGLSYTLAEEVRIHKLLMHPDDPETIYAATREGTWKTTTGGEVWYQVGSGNVRDIEFKPDDTSILYACTNRFWKSTDDGESFSVISTGMPSSFSVERMSLGVSLDEPDYVYALCVDNDGNDFLGMWKSTDAGENFELMADSPNILGYSIQADDDGGQGWYDLALAVDPNNGERLFAGGVNIWQSINGGSNYILNAHWFLEDDMQYNYTHADIHNIQYIDGDIFVCSDGGVFRSTNNAQTFTDVSKGLEIAQFYRFGGYNPNPNLLIGGTQDNGSILGVNNVWTHVRGGDGMEAAIHPANPDIMYCESQYGGMRVSLNGGDNFFNATEGIDEDGAWVTPFILHPEEEGTVIAGFQNIFKSTNNGQEYEQVTDFETGSTFRCMTVAESNPNIMFASYTTQILKSTDAGDTWESIAQGIAGNSITYIDVNPVDENEVVITFSGFSFGQKVYKSIDGGITWTNISMNLPNIPANCVAIDGENGGMYVGTDVGIYFSHPDYVNWMPYNDGLPNVIVNEIEVNPLFNNITAATYGRGIWRSPRFTQMEILPEAQFDATRQVICVGESVDFSDLSFGHNPGWNWSFPGADVSESSEQNPTVTYNIPGFYSVELEVENGVGESSAEYVDYIYVQESSAEFPYQEPFTDNDSPESFDFSSESLQGNIMWEISENEGHNDPGSLWIPNGFLDIPFSTQLTSKRLDLSDTDTAFISFWYAYAQKHPDNDDILRFSISTSCGGSWGLAEQFRGTSDLNPQELVQLEAFYPESWDWNQYVYPVPPEERTEEFAFKFEFRNDNGNHIFIDDINIGDTNLSISDFEESNTISIYPNPANDMLTVSLSVANKGSELLLLDSQGKEVKRLPHALPSGKVGATMDVSDLGSGVYFLQLINQVTGDLQTEKLIIH
ncbi:MAG: T9SS type A sorting domain-containing protein [Flavobacteriales bacterium]